MNRKYSFCIIKNEDEFSHLEWEIACKLYNQNYEIVDITRNDWLNKVTSESFDCFLLRPPGRTEIFKNLFDERVYFIENILNRKIYPSYNEVFIYENKRAQYYFMKSMDLPHLDTHIFYKIAEAELFLKTSNYPIVGKTSIGSSGEGIKILHNSGEAKKYIKTAFTKGISRKTGPSLKEKNYLNRIYHLVKSPKYLSYKLNTYKNISSSVQKGYVILQDYIDHSREIRAVKIGKSFFAYQKDKVDEMCSGTSKTSYFEPSMDLLNFLKDVCNKCNFSSMAIDIFESPEGFKINELQTIFGHRKEHLLRHDGKYGRYLYENNEWIFEEGNFNENQSFNLRLENVIDMLDKGEL